MGQKRADLEEISEPALLYYSAFLMRSFSMISPRAADAAASAFLIIIPFPNVSISSLNVT